MRNNVELVNKINEKYKIFLYDDNYYIMEKKMWYMIFPFLMWILPQKMYKIENNEKLIKINKKRNFIFTFFAVSIGMFIARILEKTMLNNKNYIAFNLKITIIILVTLISIIGMICLDTYNTKKVKKNYKINYSFKKNILIRPYEFKRILSILVTYFIFVLGGSSLGIYVYLTEGRILFLLLYILLLFMGFDCPSFMVEFCTYKVKE